MTARKLTKFIVVHCSASQPKADIGVSEIRKMHIQRGFANIGYHLVIRRDGTVENGRAIGEVGAHVQGYNSVSVGICLVGGVGKDGKTAENNFTPFQFDALYTLLRQMQLKYPGAKIVGHRDLSPDLNHNGIIEPEEWMKQCPSFDVATFLKNNGIKQ